MADTSQPHSSRCPAWLREGGLYLIVSGVVTVLKYVLLLFLPRAFAFLPMRDFGWPGIEMTLLGETFRWKIFGYDTAHGGLPYLCAYMTAMVLGECVNFPLQRRYVFRAKGHLARQVLLYALAFIVITCLVNSINCVWVAVAAKFVPDWVYTLGTHFFNGTNSAVLFFFVSTTSTARSSTKRIRQAAIFPFFFITVFSSSSRSSRQSQQVPAEFPQW